MTGQVEYPFVLGTAGHIDHGKTALVRAMTGVDCDRLSEEKRRGITIELGFAPLVLSGGRTVSIVDVPGHERFIRQMVAGSAGIDAVMLVVAADEGVMPQTREHLDIVSLLGITNGVVVLTKIDASDREILDMAFQDVRELVEGTFLGDSPIIPVSAVTGEGLPALMEAIEGLVSSVPARDRSGAFFLPVDRAFSMKGFGSVVTGTSFYGSLSEGDEVDVMPSGLRTKVRSIQVHGTPAPSVVAGQRTAINLASVSLEQVRRGDVICARGRYAPTSCFDAVLDVLRTAPEPVTHWQRLRLHIGTTDVLARVSMLGGSEEAGLEELSPGLGGVVQMMTDEPVTVAAGERFVVRFYSPLSTIGGGRVLMPYAERPQGRHERARRAMILSDLARTNSRAALLASIVRDRGYVSEGELFSLSQMERGDFDDSLERAAGEGSGGGVIRFGASGGCIISADALSDIGEAVTEALRKFHGEHPELPGVDSDEVYSSLSSQFGRALPDSKDFKSLMQLLESRGVTSAVSSGSGARFAAPGFVPEGGEKFMGLVGKIRGLAISAGYELVDVSALPPKLGVSAPEISRAISFLREYEDLRVTGDGFLFPSATREKFLALISSLDGEITIASARDAAGVSRKYALAMLEFFDSQGVTRRTGDKRVLARGPGRG
ncbi:MAG: selenocysteine-specific translation elongation factor [Synergistaceae bacterium]|nr:selenocysteine-specific translation elongation factor [Synergistaceae bacterium]